MKKLTYLFFCILFTNLVTAQVFADELVNIHSVSETEMNVLVPAESGSLAFNTSDSKLYVFNGTVWLSVALPSKKVTNELCFQDDDFYYVSIAIDGTDWEVIQYNKTDVNIELKATGSGTPQPTTLSEVDALTYI